MSKTLRFIIHFFLTLWIVLIILKEIISLLNRPHFSIWSVLIIALLTLALGAELYKFFAPSRKEILQNLEQGNCPHCHRLGSIEKKIILTDSDTDKKQEIIYSCRSCSYTLRSQKLNQYFSFKDYWEEETIKNP